jgi:hypothetical protein
MSVLGYSAVADSCERAIQFQAEYKAGIFLNELSYYQLLKKYSAPRDFYLLRSGKECDSIPPFIGQVRLYERNVDVVFSWRDRYEQISICIR